MLEERPEGSDRSSLVRSIPGRRHSKCKAQDARLREPSRDCVGGAEGEVGEESRMRSEKQGKPDHKGPYSE